MSAPATVRGLEPRDLPELVELCREHAAFERNPWAEHERVDALRSLLLGAHDARCWVVEAESELVGFACASLELSTWDAARYLHLDCLYLRAPYRGRGLGRALFERVAAAVDELGAVNLQWQTPRWNEDAARFYRRLGGEAKEKLRFTLDPAACRSLLPGLMRPAVLAAAALVVLLWASAFVAVKIALAELSPGQLAYARYVVASAAFAAIAVVRRPTRPAPRDLARLAVSGLLGISLYNLALNTGQQTVGAGIASLLVNTAPIFTALLAVLVLGERVGTHGWVGAVVSFAGVALIGLSRNSWAGFDAGVLAILGAAIAQALYFVLLAPLLVRYHPLDVTTWAVWFGCLFLAPFGIGLFERLGTSSPRTLFAIGFLGIGPAALAYVAWSYVLVEVPAGRASRMLYLVPVAAIALGALVLGEAPSRASLLGGALALTGVAIGARSSTRTKPMPASVAICGREGSP